MNYHENLHSDGGEDARHDIKAQDPVRELHAHHSSHDNHGLELAERHMEIEHGPCREHLAKNDQDVEEKKEGEKDGDKEETKGSEGDANEESEKKDDTPSSPKRSPEDIRKLEELMILIAGSKDMLHDGKTKGEDAGEAQESTEATQTPLDGIPELTTGSSAQEPTNSAQKSPKRKVSDAFCEGDLPYRAKLQKTPTINSAGCQSPTKGGAIDPKPVDSLNQPSIPRTTPTTGSSIASSKERAEDSSQTAGSGKK
ncbi:hypothetical protein PVAG01_00632 [Phlyctema vagabunda]|uniref:Uncharacterized protein n=1 Tax=Phlyctema vagabunda TaxID=108571 RepID=A0ABR4PUT7_9HELO